MSRALLKSLSATDLCSWWHRYQTVLCPASSAGGARQGDVHVQKKAYPLKSASNRKSAAAKGIMLCQTMSYTPLSTGNNPAGAYLSFLQ